MTMKSMLPDPIAERLARSGVVAVVTVENPDDAGPIARALLAGGVGAIELTFRTARAAEAIRRIRAEVPEILAGAGTLLLARTWKRHSRPALCSARRQAAIPRRSRPPVSADCLSPRAS